MNCPYCGITFSLDGVNADHCFPHFGRIPFPGASAPRNPNDKDYTITSHKCPECKGQIMWLRERGNTESGEIDIVSTTLLFPKYPIKRLPDEIPEKFASDFREAYDALPISPKASAALSRRSLQNLIREKEGIVEKTLYAEVDKLLKTNKLPKTLADDLDAIRVVGNFAAHPIKDTNTGEIVDVEPGEAEWTLNVLEELLVFYFVQEPKSAARRDALNKKLKESGKGPMLKP
jgi:hypothetical protein